MTFADDVKRWWHSLTIWFGSFLVVLGAVIEYVNASSGLLAPYFGKWGGLVTLAIGVLSVLLRLRTTMAIGKPKTGGTN